MNILVLGGNGFIGSHLVDQLILSGHKVRVFDRSPEQFRKPLKRVDYQYGNFNDGISVSEALHGIQVVVHLISTSVPSTSNLNPIEDVNNNLVGTVGLLESMRKTSIRKIIYISSGGTVYGDSKELMISEEHPLNPICSYGIVKLAVEKYLLMYQTLYEFEPTILRVSNPYGPRQGRMGLQGLVGTILNKVIEKDAVEIWGDGEVVRDYLYISDLVRACVLAVDKKVTGVFNVGCGQGYSINQVIQLIENVSSCKVNVNRLGIRDIDVKRSVLNIDKVSGQLGWSPEIDIKEGLIKHYEWLKSL